MCTWKSKVISFTLDNQCNNIEVEDYLTLFVCMKMCWYGVNVEVLVVVFDLRSHYCKVGCAHEDQGKCIFLFYKIFFFFTFYYIFFWSKSCYSFGMILIFIVHDENDIYIYFLWQCTFLLCLIWFDRILHNGCLQGVIV